MPRARPVLAALLPAALLLAGCSAPEPDAGEARLVQPAAFDAVDAPWAAQVTGGCGFCIARSGFAWPSDHHALFVHSDARVVLVEFNGGHVDGAPRTYVAENVTFDEATVAALLDDSPRAQRGELWVTRVVTGSLVTKDTLDALGRAWAPDAPDNRCTDSGIDFLRRAPDGRVEHQRFSCGPASGPMLEYADTLRRMVDEMRAFDPR